MKSLLMKIAVLGAFLTALPLFGELRLNEWQVIGPITAEQLVESEADKFLTEPLDAACGVKVQHYINPRNPDLDGLFFIEFFKDIPETKAVAYAATTVEMPEACYYLLKLNTDFDVEVYINGQQVSKVGPSFNNFILAEFKAGQNRIAVKSYHEAGFWAVVLTALEGPVDKAGAEKLMKWVEEYQTGGKLSHNFPAINGLFVGDTGEQPQLKWQDAADYAAVFGENKPKITWFDAQMNETIDFNRSGLYYALIEVETLAGKPYKALHSYYLLPSGWREDPKIIKFAEAMCWEKPFDSFESTWMAIPQRLQAYLEFGDTELDVNRKPGVSPYVLAWKQANYPLEIVELAPPEELENPAVTLRYGTEAEAGFKPGSVEKFDAVCNEWYNETQNAFSCIIARNGVIVYAKGFGKLFGQPVNITTPCGMASISKFITGIMFARFLDQKLMDLDEDMVRFMPALANSPEWKLTPRRCFNHSCNFDGHGNFGGIRNVFCEYGASCWLPGVRPGSECNYNGVGPNLMASYMMNATATPIDRLYENSYFRKLGITSISGDDQGGGYVASTEDLAKLAQMMLNKGSYGKWKFFSAETYKLLMPRNLMPDNPDIKMTTTWFFGWYGVGIHPFYPPVENQETVQYYGHGSATASVLDFDPKYQTLITQARNANEKPELNDKYRKQLEQTVWDAIEK